MAEELEQKSNEEASKEKKPKLVDDSSDFSLAGFLVKVCNIALEIAIALECATLLGKRSFLFAAVAWLILQLLENFYIVHRNPEITKAVLSGNKDKSAKLVNEMMPELVLIDLGLFVLLRLGNMHF